jgi:uncharacterized protein YjiS (DUF1127 family)
MDIEIDDNLDLEQYLGQSIPQDVLNRLITDGRISFPKKESSSPNFTSTGDPSGSCAEKKTKKTKEEFDAIRLSDIEEFVANVKRNEETLKALEDMRDDLLKDMSIEPSNADIKEAAEKLGSKDGTITKDIFDRARVILKPDFLGMLRFGSNFKFSAIFGNGVVNMPDMKCNNITQAVFSGFSLALDKQGEKKEKGEDYHRTVKEDVQEAELKFKDLMKQMMQTLLRTLFWNHIWGTIWVSVFDLLEEVIAKPIDSIVIVIKSLLRRKPKYKINDTNFHIYGWIHPKLNSLRIKFLCMIPRKNFKEYKPDVNLQVWNRKENKYIFLVELCTKAGLTNMCTETSTKKFMRNSADINVGDNLNDLESVSNALPTNDNERSDNPTPYDELCSDSDLDKLFEDIAKNDKSDGVTPECIAAAQEVAKAVYYDSLYS